MGDRFNQPVVQALRERVSGLCSNPSCRCSTLGPNSDDGKATRVGVAAHITAASPGGPRYDHSLSSQQRASASNGIWLCRICERLIDVDPDKYPPSLLLKWKADAEDESSRNLGVPKKRDVAVPAADYTCLICNTGFATGQTVCKGCRGQIVWGATYQERKSAAVAGMAIAGFPSLWLYSRLGINFLNFDAGIKGLIPFLAALLVSFATGLAGANLVEKYRRKRLPRVYVRTYV